MASKPDNKNTPSAMSSQERVARDLLASGRFRKARDEFKVLCKADRQKYLPLLVEANIGLAREMLGKNMVEEARQVLVYLKTIARPEQLRVLELELNVNSKGAGSGVALADMLELLALSVGSELECRRIVDQAVLTMETVANPRTEVASTAAEFQMVVLGLRAISEGQFQKALDLVRPLGQASIFSHWKTFIKGLAAFHVGERDKAVRLLTSLPPDSVPGKARQPYLLLAEAQPVTKNSPLPSVTVLDAACRLTGARGCGSALRMAEDAWRKGKPAEAYRHLRKNIPSFPSEDMGLIGALSEFSTQCIFLLPVEQKYDFLEFIGREIDQESHKNLVEQQLFLRLLVIKAASVELEDMDIDYWAQYLTVRAKLYGPNPALESMANGWLGELLSKPTSGFGGNKSRLKDAEPILLEALRLDPMNLKASLTLCRVYQDLRQTSDRNRLLDKMTARFPTDKSVLLLAGKECMERKAFKKGITYIETALQVDRLDPAIPDALVEGCLMQAREFFQKGRDADARAALDKTSIFEVESTDNLIRSRWALKIQRGLIEINFGDLEPGSALVAEGGKASPSRAVFLYYAGLIATVLMPKAQNVYFNEFAAIKEADPAQAAILTRLWLRGKELDIPSISFKSDDLLGKYLVNASKESFSRELAGRLLEFCDQQKDFQSIGLAMIKNWRKKDQSNPLLGLYELRFGIASHVGPSSRDVAAVEAIIAEATRRKDDATVRLARQQLDGWKNRAHPPIDDFIPNDSYDDDDDGITASAMDALLPGMSPEKMRAFQGILAMMASATDETIEMMRKTRPRDMPSEIFEMLVMVARMRRASDGGDSPFGSRRGSKSGKNQNQQDFFE